MDWMGEKGSNLQRMGSEPSRMPISTSPNSWFGVLGSNQERMDSKSSRMPISTTPNEYLVWEKGFEPSTSAFQVRHSNQAELHPDILKFWYWVEDSNLVLLTHNQACNHCDLTQQKLLSNKFCGGGLAESNPMPEGTHRFRGGPRPSLVNPPFCISRAVSFRLMNE